jgi:SAM-dependent methyltransferase
MSSETGKPSYLVHPGYRINLTPTIIDINGPGIYLDTIVVNVRSHEGVDHILGKWVSHEIGKRITGGEVPVETLDIGGGSDSTAAIGFKKKFGDAISIANLDLVLREDLDSQGVERVLGRADEIPLPDASRSVIYSTNAFMWMRREMQERALREIARVMKPGGRALIHQQLFPAHSNPEPLRGLGVDANVFNAAQISRDGNSGIGLMLVIDKPVLATPLG